MASSIGSVGTSLAQLVGAYAGSGRQPGTVQLGEGFDASQWLASRAADRRGYIDEQKLTEYLQTLAEKPSADPLLMVFLAQRLADAGRTNEEVAWLRKAESSLGSGSAAFPINIDFLLGAALGRVEDYDGAKTALESAKNSYLFPQNAGEIFGMLASVYASSDKPENAYRSAIAAIQESPQDDRAWLIYKTLKVDLKNRGLSDSLPADTSPEMKEILGLGFVGAWAPESIEKNSETYLRLADSLTLQNRTSAAQNYKDTVAAAALSAAQSSISNAKYDESLRFFSLADRAVELSSFDPQNQDQLLPFMTTAYLKQGMSLAACKMLEGFPKASRELRQHLFAAVLERAYVGISWNVDTKERTLNDPSGFADLLSGEKTIPVEWRMGSTPSEKWPERQLRGLWRSDFRYGMTNPDEDVTTLGSDLSLAPLLVGQEVDVLLAEGKIELPVKILLLELEAVFSPMIGVLEGTPQMKAGKLQFRIMNQQRLDKLYKVIQASPPDAQRPETIEAAAAGDELFRMLQAR